MLNVSTNELTDISLHVFRIPTLEMLDVSHNKITVLPGADDLMETTSTGTTASRETSENVWLCTRLKKLLASHNHLKRLPETFGDVLNLLKLDVSFNELRILPRSLSKARFLERANLDNNSLGSATDVDFSFSCLPRCVKRLSVSNNSLKRIPHSLASITSLRELYCANNSMSSLPPKKEWELPHLELLNLSENEFGQMEGTMEFLESFSKSLTSLNLSHNGLKNFPEGILALQMVVYLNLEG